MLYWLPAWNNFNGFFCLRQWFLAVRRALKKLRSFSGVVECVWSTLCVRITKNLSFCVRTIIYVPFNTLEFMNRTHTVYFNIFFANNACLKCLQKILLNWSSDTSWQADLTTVMHTWCVSVVYVKDIRKTGNLLHPSLICARVLGRKFYDNPSVLWLSTKILCVEKISYLDDVSPFFRTLYECWGVYWFLTLDVVQRWGLYLLIN